MSPDDTARNRQVLARRAARLAAPPAAPDTSERLTVVQVTIGREEYAVEPAYVREVFRFTDLTRVPCTPGYVLGIVNVRGRVVCLIDLRVFFEIPQQGLHDRSRALILAADHMEFGVLIDGVAGTRQIPTAAIEPALPSLTGIRVRYLRGVTPDGVAILDGRLLLGDASLIVGRGVRSSPTLTDHRPPA